VTPPQEKGVGAGQGSIYIFELYYIKNDNFLRCICGDMEMSPTYTDMYVKTMPGKMTEGGCPNVIENK